MNFRNFGATAISVILLVITSCTSRYTNPGAPVANFSLLDVQGRYFELLRHKNAKAIVLISFGIGCPIMAKNIPVIRQIRDRYKSQGVQFFYLDANTQDDHESLKAYAAKYEVDIPILVDRSQTIASSLGISRMAQALVIDPTTWQVVYDGMIDDRLDYGIENQQAKNDYLRLAIEGVLQGKKIETPRTQTAGCSISFEKTPEPITFSEHIAPILSKKCLICHREEGFPPTNMQTYQQVRGWSSMIKEVIRTNRMPPWEVDPHVGKFKETRYLTEQETRLFIKWIDSGMNEGKPLKVPPKPPEPKIDRRVDRVLTGLQNFEIPPRMAKPWSYTTVIESQPQDEWYQAFASKLSNPSVVQHFALLVLSKCLDKTDDGFEPQLRMKEGKLLNILRFAPSRLNYRPLTEGVALKIPRGACVVLEHHFASTGKLEKFSSEVLMQKYRGKSKPREYIYMPIWNAKFLVPPEKENFEVRAENLVEKDFHIYQIAVHMHKRGESMKLEALGPDGKSELLFSLPHYLYQHRVSYTFEKPVFVKAGTRLRATAVYNNSLTNPYNPDPQQSVSFGPDLNSQEMMVMHVSGY